MKLYAVSYTLKENIRTDKWLYFLHKIKFISKNWCHPIDPLWIIQVNEMPADKLLEVLYDKECFNYFIIIEIKNTFDNVAGYFSTVCKTWIKEIQNEQNHKV